MNYYRFFSRIYQKAAEKMCQDCRDFIKKGSKILDLGCGSGIIGKTFQDFFQAEIIGLDIQDIRAVNIPFRFIDGKNLPFPEKSFDVVLINYVLHHSKDPLALLKESKRVARDKIIIHEDLLNGFLASLICRLHGSTYRAFHQQKNSSSFRSEGEWEKIFKELGLNIIFKKRVNNFPIKKELFILGI